MLKSLHLVDLSFFFSLKSFLLSNMSLCPMFLSHSCFIYCCVHQVHKPLSNNVINIAFVFFVHVFCFVLGSPLYSKNNNVPCLLLALSPTSPLSTLHSPSIPHHPHLVISLIVCQIVFVLVRRFIHSVFSSSFCAYVFIYYVSKNPTFSYALFNTV